MSPSSQNADLESSMKTVKMIRRARFELRLVETPSGTYRICYEKDEKTIIGEPVSDYSLAAMLFDLKLIELEGH